MIIKIQNEVINKLNKKKLFNESINSILKLFIELFDKNTYRKHVTNKRNSFNLLLIWNKSSTNPIEKIIIEKKINIFALPNKLNELNIKKFNKKNINK